MTRCDGAQVELPSLETELGEDFADGFLLMVRSFSPPSRLLMPSIDIRYKPPQ